MSVNLPTEPHRLWVSKDWWNVIGQGYGATIEANGADGFEFRASNGFLSFWAMRWWLRKQERVAEGQYAEWPQKVQEMRRAGV